ncbi:MAG: 4-hydroxybenzoyl-CoA reductase subunit beta [Sulfuritalea sp.]|nr:4-hydroxybenzoyl-CoA reductase subunit beta [Sulfuritalea sp.]MDP1984457.1 4-hydroxybenzoyl-CoA reductase subunit beta [Sulfuritalea sp.]
MNALPNFQLLRPTTAADAVAMRAANAASRYIAGGTDLLPNIRRGLMQPEVVIDLGGIADLSYIEQGPDAIRIGAGTTLAKIAAHPALRRHFAALAEAAEAVAGPTHRVAATLGGNLCLDTRCVYYNQSESWREGNHYCMKLKGEGCRVAKKSRRCYAAFSGDVAPALIALDAEVEILGPSGSRRVASADFYRDDGMAWLTLGADELLTGVRVPLQDGWRSAYEKVRVRGAIDFPLAGVAVALKRKGDVLDGLRIACTGVASRPLAIDGLAELQGKTLDAVAMASIVAQTEIAAGAMRTTVVDMLYRRGVAPVLARRLVEKLWSATA